jgi:transposase-like protein
VQKRSALAESHLCAGEQRCLFAQSAGSSGASWKTKLGSAAKTLEEGSAETLTYTNYPSQHWLRIRTNNGIERINREIRRRTRVVGCFPDGNSALMLVCARLRHVSASQWGEKVYLNMQHLYELEKEQAN